MFYFTMLDTIVTFSFAMFCLDLFFLLCVYLIPLKSNHYLIRKSTLIINLVLSFILLLDTIFVFLVNYQFENLFHQQKELKSSLTITITSIIIYLVLILVWTIYLLSFNFLFIIYFKNGLVYTGAFKTQHLKWIHLIQDSVTWKNNKKFIRHLKSE